MKRAGWILCVAAAAAACAGVRAEESKPVEPFNGKDLSGWKPRGDAAKSKWKVGKASLDPADPKLLACGEGGSDLVNVVGGSHGGGVDNLSEATFGDIHLEVEVLVAKGSNSGIYLMGNYEIQVLDSFGREKPGPGDMGGLYGASAPKVNACKPHGEWQQYVVDFRAPRFDADGKKTANARFVKVTLNGQVLHEEVEMKGVTGGAISAEAPTGPLMFQGDHGPVAYRSIRITPLAKPGG
jgi:hypothetical protein